MADTANQPGPAAVPTYMPQTGALQAPTGVAGADDDAAAEDLAAGPSPIAQSMAQHTIAAGQINNGDPGDWAKNAVAGVQTALAGFGAGGKVPPGAGALYGVGAAARQAQERNDELAKEKRAQGQRQQQIDIEKQRLTDEKNNTDFDHKLRLGENARQQALAVREIAEHDRRMAQFTDEHNLHNFAMMKADVDFRNEQLEREETLKAVGAKPLKIAGVETPAFDDLGQLEKYAMDNKLGEDAHSNGYRTRPVFGADQKYHLYELPDNPPDWHTVKDADGKPQRIFGDPLSVANYQEKVAQTREANSRANMTYTEAKKQANQLKDEGTVKAARKELTSVGGDYSKLSPGSRDALRIDAQKQFTANFNVLQTARRDMERDPDYSAVPTDARGNPDENSKEYKELAQKYHVDDAEAELGESQDNLRQLGHGYNKPGAAEAPKNNLPEPPQKGAAITSQIFDSFVQANGGDRMKAKAAAQAAGWGPPAPQGQPVVRRSLVMGADGEMH